MLRAEVGFQMSTENSESNRWRYHKVPTFADVEDAVIGGLSGKQLVGIVIALVSGFGVFQILGALPMMPRLLACAAVASIVAGLIAIRPGGRSLFMYLLDWVFLYLGPRYYGDRVTSLVSSRAIDDADRRRGKGGVQIVVRIPLPGRSYWTNMFFRVPFKRARSKVQIGMALLAGCLGMALSTTTACSSDVARAQVPEEYAGKRVYLQSIVANLGNDISTGGQAVSVQLKAAAPLKWAGPRVNETLQSVYDLDAHRTRVSPGWRRAGSAAEIEPVASLETGDELSFEDIYVGDRLDLRPYCDVSTGIDGHYINPDLSPPQRSRRIHSKDCRIRPPGGVGSGRLSVDEALSKPALSINWEDRKQNQGALSISRSMLPFPGPSLEEIGVEVIDPGGAELLNIDALCKMNDTNVISLGLQSEKPSSSPPDYFDGQGGRWIAGEVRTCPLASTAFRTARVILPETTVFAAGNSDYEIRVRPAVDTFRADDIVNNATLTVLDNAGNSIFSKSVPKAGDAEYDPLKPDTVKFNIAPPAYEPKEFSTDLDTAIIQIQIEIEHVVTVIRPVYQPIAFYPERRVSHIRSCGCSKSSGSCNSSGNCSCSCSSRSTSAWFTYWEDHYRVDEKDREFLPDDPSAEVFLLFSQTLLFEPMAVTFEQPYQELVYIEPTPEPGEVREKPYFSSGDRLGLWDSEPLICRSGVGQDDEGRWTGWLWVEPGVNSAGEPFGGCRRAYGCKLDIPAVEEPFGAGGTPTEEDYECINRE